MLPRVKKYIERSIDRIENNKISDVLYDAMLDLLIEETDELYQVLLDAGIDAEESAIDALVRSFQDEAEYVRSILLLSEFLSRFPTFDLTYESRVELLNDSLRNNKDILIDKYTIRRRDV